MRFHFTIENEDEEVIMEGSTYVSEINIDGGCESIEMELFSALRALRKILVAGRLLANEKGDV